MNGASPVSDDDDDDGVMWNKTMFVHRLLSVYSYISYS